MIMYRNMNALSISYKLKLNFFLILNLKTTLFSDFNLFISISKNTYYIRRGAIIVHKNSMLVNSILKFRILNLSRVRLDIILLRSFFRKTYNKTFS